MEGREKNNNETKKKGKENVWNKQHCYIGEEKEKERKMLVLLISRPWPLSLSNWKAEDLVSLHVRNLTNRFSFYFSLL